MKVLNRFEVHAVSISGRSAMPFSSSTNIQTIQNKTKRKKISEFRAKNQNIKLLKLTLIVCFAQSLPSFSRFNRISSMVDAEKHVSICSRYFAKLNSPSPVTQNSFRTRSTSFTFSKSIKAFSNAWSFSLWQKCVAIPAYKVSRPAKRSSV